MQLSMDGKKCMNDVRILHPTVISWWQRRKYCVHLSLVPWNMPNATFLTLFKSLTKIEISLFLFAEPLQQLFLMLLYPFLTLPQVDCSLNRPIIFISYFLNASHIVSYLFSCTHLSNWPTDFWMSVSLTFVVEWKSILWNAGKGESTKPRWWVSSACLQF